MIIRIMIALAGSGYLFYLATQIDFPIAQIAISAGGFAVLFKGIEPLLTKKDKNTKINDKQDKG